MWGGEEFRFKGPDDFVRLDGLCAKLLGEFFSWLQTAEGGGLAAETASDLSHAADRYLRDFVVDITETGPAEADATLPRRYLGNWYILNTLTPSHPEVERILQALRRLYEFLNNRGIVAKSVGDQVSCELEDSTHFHQRLEDFWKLTPKGVGTWRRIDDYRRRSAPTDVH